MSAISLLAGAFTGALELAAQLLRLKRVKLPPKLEGPVHVYPSELSSSVTYYAMHCCTKCGLFNENRAAYTVPACSQRRPAGVELP